MIDNSSHVLLFQKLIERFENVSNFYLNIENMIDFGIIKIGFYLHLIDWNSEWKARYRGEDEKQMALCLALLVLFAAL